MKLESYVKILACPAFLNISAIGWKPYFLLNNVWPYIFEYWSYWLKAYLLFMAFVKDQKSRFEDTPELGPAF